MRRPVAVAGSAHHADAREYRRWGEDRHDLRPQYLDHACRNEGSDRTPMNRSSVETAHTAYLLYIDAIRRLRRLLSTSAMSPKRQLQPHSRSTRGAIAALPWPLQAWSNYTGPASDGRRRPAFVVVKASPRRLHEPCSARSAGLCGLVGQRGSRLPCFRPRWPCEARLSQSATRCLWNTRSRARPVAELAGTYWCSTPEGAVRRRRRDDCSVTDGAVRRRGRRAAVARPSRQRGPDRRRLLLPRISVSRYACGAGQAAARNALTPESIAL